MLSTTFNRRDRCRGFTLVEMLVAMAMLVILMALAFPNFSAWIRNSKIRAAASSIQNGLQIARAEAVRRNVPVHFQLVDTSCKLNAEGPSWIVSLDKVDGNCALNTSTAPRGIQFWSGVEAKTLVLGRNANNDMVDTFTFNAMGRLVNASVTNNIKVYTSKDTTNLMCMGEGGGERCLNVTISAGGQIRMCDPSLPSTDPQGC